MKKEESNIINKQREFFIKGKTGCMFATVASREPDKYEWSQKIIYHIDSDMINQTIQDFLDDINTSTASLIFPTVNEIEDLLSLLNELEKCDLIITEKQEYMDFLCYGFRVKVLQKKSWLTGFGSFDFFPKTRKAPFTEVIFRVKDRPKYEWVMKKSPENILHLADMDMKGISKEKFISLWNSSLKNTERILGHKPDFISAAKTSFSIPLSLLK